MTPKDVRPPHRQSPKQAAASGPVGVGHPTFAEAAARLLDNGYEPLPIVPGAKRPALSRWSSVDISLDTIEAWAARYPNCGVGLRTGRLLGLDIDCLDPDRAHDLHRLAVARFGDTLIRVGLWPKRLLVYRASEPRPKQVAHKVEVLGLGQQFVAFGVHPDTGRPYYWPESETPLDVPLSDLPRVETDEIDAFLAEAGGISPQKERPHGGRRRVSAGARQGPVRDAAGRVVDGRDGWLSSIAFHAAHDAIDRGCDIDAAALGQEAWRRFEMTTDLSRPRQSSGRGYALSDARRKVEDKLRLHLAGRLPSRASEEVEPREMGTLRPVEEARAALDAAIRRACAEILAWHESADGDAPSPRIGIRATVGLGKSALARRALLQLRRDLTRIDAPDRIAVFTPSHALAEEAASAWAAEGVRVAVHRGYERIDPATRRPMCLDLDVVRLAIRAGEPVRETACADRRGNRCRFFDSCAKQQNVAEVATADVVFAAYDALFTGFAADTSSFGALLIDEGCWQRARRETDRTDLKRFGTDALVGLRAKGGAIPSAAAQADLHALRLLLIKSCEANGEGPLARAVLEEFGLSADDCRAARKLEKARLRKLGLQPGATAADRQAAARIAASNAEVLRHIRLWGAAASFLDGAEAMSGRIRVEGELGRLCVAVDGVHALHRNLRETPILHLDATLRPDLARTVLPRLTVETIEAEAAHMKLRLIPGAFGKGALIQSPRASPKENARRGRNLAVCVDHVAWEARRVLPGRTLVITYMDCEDAFRGIEGVETAHFNAIAGLDGWKDVALLIVIGRPLPPDIEAEAIAGAFFDRRASGGYRNVRRGVRMRDGRVRGVTTMEHGDPSAETSRAAICDDELIQAIGRGRGVNRMAADPLEVQVLADVALPLVHDALADWRTVAPDLFQRMLLRGVATDSPKDASVLHPDLFAGENQAKKQFQADGFKGQIPTRDIYRGMTLKSARYRLPGQGHGWARAWWIDGDADSALQELTRALGDLAEWGP